jgi:hypothetical protein
VGDPRSPRTSRGRRHKGRCGLANILCAGSTRSGLRSASVIGQHATKIRRGADAHAPLVGQPTRRLAMRPSRASCKGASGGIRASVLPLRRGPVPVGIC